MPEGLLNKSQGYEFDVIGTRKVKIFGEDVEVRHPFSKGQLAERQFILSVDGEEFPVWLKAGMYGYDESRQKVIIHGDAVMEENIGDLRKYINIAKIVSIE